MKRQGRQSGSPLARWFSAAREVVCAAVHAGFPSTRRVKQKKVVRGRNPSSVLIRSIASGSGGPNQDFDGFSRNYYFIMYYVLCIMYYVLCIMYHYY